MVVAANAGSKPDSELTLRSRGAYIVHQVAQCTDCHSPATASGSAEGRIQLTGADTSFKPTDDVPNWSKHAPDITPAGAIKGWTKDQLVNFFVTGKDPSGHWANPPMPQFRLSRADAKAVAVYLRHMPGRE